MDNIPDFLYLIGSVFAPMIAIQIADYYILKKDHSVKAVDICNLIIWAAGFGLYRYLIYLDGKGIDFILGYTLIDMAATIVICVVVGVVRKKLFEKKHH